MKTDIKDYFLNVILKDLDKNYKNYFRYVDDILIFSNSLDQLKTIKDEIKTILKQHDLRLNFEKTQIKANIELDYLGYILTKKHTRSREKIMKNFFEFNFQVLLRYLFSLAHKEGFSLSAFSYLFHNPLCWSSYLDQA